jgi:steroid delta-isomerase-like uncharacterized protein
MIGRKYMEEEEYTIPQMVDDVRAGKMPRRKFITVLAAMGISVAGIGAITAAASRSFTPAPTSKVTSDKEAAKHFEQHAQHLSNQQQGNVGALSNDYAEHAIVEDSMYAQPIVGRAAIMARKNVGMSAIPGLKINVTNRVVKGSQLTVEWVATGTHSGHYPGLPAATGRSFSIPGVTVVVRHKGQIVRESLYYDMAEVQRQLGSR